MVKKLEEGEKGNHMAWMIRQSIVVHYNKKDRGLCQRAKALSYAVQIVHIT